MHMLPGTTPSSKRRSARDEAFNAAQVEYWKDIIRTIDELRALHPHLAPPYARPAAASPTPATAPAREAPGAVCGIEPSNPPLRGPQIPGVGAGARTKVNHQNAIAADAADGLSAGSTRPRSQSKIVNPKSKITYTPPMPVPRLRIDEATLLVIDMQEKLMPTIADGERITHNTVALLQVAEILGMPYLITEQYPTGLGRTVEAITAAMEDQSRRIEKTRFSAAVDIVLEQLHAWRRPSVIICGVEAHVCVVQSVMDLQAAGRQCFVCIDAISAGQREQVPWALRRMERAGAVITGVLSAVYEMLVDSDHPSFKACLELMKDLKQ
jgi:nicotinamidase-related amidase